LSTLLVMLLIPNLATCQITQTMRYKIVNGRVYYEAPSTTPPSLLQTLFPFLSISYQSSNTPEVDEAIINSVSGPPAPPESGGVLSLPSFSSYQSQSGVNTNQIGSPYLPDDDSYEGSDSVNQYQYVMPPMNAPKAPGYSNPNSIYSNQPVPNPYANVASPLPYPTGIPIMATTTEKSTPFYQPILDLFGWGSSEEEDVANMLPSPGEILNMGSFPSEAIPQIGAYQPAQARHSFVVNPYIEEEFAGDVKETENTESENESPSTSSDDESKKPGDEAKNVTATSSDSASSDKKFPCPKLGFWQWDGENCIAIGPSPIWGCKPNDLVMSGRIAVCRNKIFFPQGLNHPGN